MTFRSIRVAHVGNSSNGEGGIATVIRNHLERSVPGISPMAIASYDQNARSVWARSLPAARAFTRVWRLRKHIDVLHIHLSRGGSLVREGAIALAYSRTLPVVVTLHGSSLASSGAWTRFVVRMILKSATLVHGFSERYRAILSIDSAKWRSIPNDVRVPAAESLVPLASRVHEIVFVGEVGERKGVDLLLDAWRHVRATGWKLVLIGPIALGNRTVAELRRDDSIEVTGNVTHSAALARIASAAVVALPSRAEAFPMVVCEALSVATPVVGSDVGAMGSLLAAAGQIVVPLDAEAIATSLAALLDSEERRGELGRAGYGYAREALDAVVVGQTWLDTYCSLAKPLSEIQR